MRTTIRIDEQIYRSAKARAAERGRTVSEFIEDAVRDKLQERPGHEAEPPPLPVFGGSGVLPGVDLADAGSLRDLMDASEPLDARR